MAKGDKIKCAVCSREKIQRGNRPIEYCSQECGNVAKFYNAFTASLDKVKHRIKGKDLRRLKSELFLLRNSL